MGARRYAAILATLSGLAGCATTKSYVAPMAHASDAREIAARIAGYLSTRWPPLVTTLAVEEPPQPNSFDADLRRSLTTWGFALAAPGTPGSHDVLYRVSPLENGEVIRLVLDHRIELARFYARGVDGVLSFGGPVARIELTAAAP